MVCFRNRTLLFQVAFGTHRTRNVQRGNDSQGPLYRYPRLVCCKYDKSYRIVEDNVIHNKAYLNVRKKSSRRKRLYTYNIRNAQDAIVARFLHAGLNERYAVVVCPRKTQVHRSNEAERFDCNATETCLMVRVYKARWYFADLQLLSNADSQ